MSTRPRRLFRILGVLCICAGVVLLGIAAAGQWTSWGKGHNYEKRDWERFDPSLVLRTPDYDALLAAVDQKLAGQPQDPAKLQAMYEVVVDRFTHEEALHTLASNWILYTAGFLHSTFRHIWSTDRLVTQGSSLLCDQASYLLLRLAREHGFKARHVGLQGHVVMEVWYDGDWHLYDPDLEVVPLDGAGKVLGLEDLARDEALLQRYYGRHTNMADLIRARENHLFMSTPDGARFEWKGNILALIEKATEWLKFLIPLAMIASGWWLARKPRPQTVAS